ncbi:MAG: hypothetical protein AAGE52_00770 [Myxococcota bacterium]
MKGPKSALDGLSRRGFVGVMAAGAASLWMPTARADGLTPRWVAEPTPEKLAITLFLRQSGGPGVQVPQKAIALEARLTHPQRGEWTMSLVPTEAPSPRFVSRIGPRPPRPILLSGTEERSYDTFSAPWPYSFGLYGTTVQVQIAARVQPVRNGWGVDPAPLGQLTGTLQIRIPDGEAA